MTDPDGVLMVTDQYLEGPWVYTLLGYNNKPTFLHINNIKTNNNSVLVPLDVVMNIIDISILRKVN